MESNAMNVITTPKFLYVSKTLKYLSRFDGKGVYIMDSIIWYCFMYKINLIKQIMCDTTSDHKLDRNYQTTRNLTNKQANKLLANDQICKSGNIYIQESNMKATGGWLFVNIFLRWATIMTSEVMK